MHLFSSRCLSVCVLIATLFCSVSLSAQKAYTISSGNNYLAHRYNTTTSGYELYTTRVFSDSCVWYSPNTNNYYFMSIDGTTRYYLSAAFATRTPPNATDATDSDLGAGALLTIVAENVAVTASLGSNTSNYYFYNWDWGLAHGQQYEGYEGVSCPSEFNSEGSECWRAYWLVYDNALGGSEPRWHMSTTSSYEPLEHIATFEPVRIIRHQVTANAQTGGLSAISGGAITFGGSISPFATIGDYSDQTTPAYTSMATGALDNCRGDWTVRVCDTIWTTHNFYPTMSYTHDHGTAEPPAVEHEYTLSDLTSSSYRWTLSGAGTAYLTLSGENTATPTVTYSTSCYDASGSTATLTLTITWPDGSTQSATAVITIPQHLENPTAMTVAPSTMELVEGGAAGELELTFTPTEHVNTTVNSVSSPTGIATTSGTTVTPESVGQTTVTVTSAVAPSVSGSVTVLVRPAAPTISYTMSNDQALVTLTNRSTQCSAGQLQYKIGSGDWTNYSAAFLVNSGVEITARLLCTTCGTCGEIASPEVKESPVVTSGVRGSYVILNDYEDHSWSYYSDPQCPIRSLNPVDVKITYYGNGTNNMTTTDVADNPTTFNANATGVKVGIAAGEDQNTFVYYKTLERLDGKDATSIADANDVAPYTTIPNPFQVRPTYGTSAVPTTSTVYISGSAYNGTISVAYTDENGDSQTWTRTNQTNQTGTITVRDGTTITVSASGRTTTTPRSYSTITTRYNNSTGEIIVSLTCNRDNYTSGTSSSATVGSSVSDDKFRGFYAWRVKSVPTGGTVYRNSNATGAITTGAIINAETPIYFLPTDNNTKMGLELEALWAQAYVQKGNTAMSEYVPDGVTSAHERNFHVLNANANLVNVYNKGYSFTLSSYNPDGTSGTGANLRMTTAVDLTHDLRIENIGISNNYNGDNRLNANGKHLHIGRGIPTTYNFAYELRAAAGNVACEDARLRVESGKYYRVRIINDNVSEDNFHATIVFGCDYDRARATDDDSYNALLSVTPTGNNGIFFGNAGVLTNSNNRRRWTAHWTIKSGTFQEAQHGNTDCAYDQVIYIGTTGEKNSYVGKRSIVVEGGVLAGIAGGRGPQATGSSSSTPTANDITYVDPNDTVALIRIKGGTIKGSVYGGAASSAAYGHRIIVITGSVIDGWVAGGCNGDNAEYAGIGYGNSYIYVGGNSSIGMGSSTDRKIPNSTTGTPGGYVFGTGRGGHLNNVVKASMLNSTVVIADNTQVQRSVFGGGNYGRVYEGDAISNNWGMGTSAEHKADIHILGGTVYGDVYGGANQAAGQKVVVTMRDGDVKGNIYGGSNIFGTINQNVDINIIGGTVEGTVYGGGKGVQTRVAKDVAVTVGGTATVQTDVYGGSEEGLVNNNSAAATTATNTNVNRNTDNTTTVTVSGGQVDGNVYGGGYGLNNSFAHVAGDVTVNITGGVVNGSVFGCNNANGRPMGTVTVNMSGGVVEHNLFGGGNQAAYGRNGADAVREPYVRMSNGLVKGSVFGGGLGTPAVIYQGTDVHIYGGAKVVGDVYGGGNAARVTGNTNVVIGN